MRIAFLFLCLTFAAPSWAACRHALVLGLDVSGSVDSREHRLQLDGLADALLDPDVQEIIFSDPSAPISIAVYEWSAVRHQRLLLDWVSIETPADLQTIATVLKGRRKLRVPVKTAIGSAVNFGAAMLAEKSECWRLTIDISGDGENNAGRLPRAYYQTSVFRDVEVNALVIGDGSKDAEPGIAVALKAYFEKNVIRGPGAFTILASGYQDYARAMKKKLIKELSPKIVSQLK